MCADNTTIDDYLKLLEIRLNVVNTYFDFDDYSDPIKSYIDDRFLIHLVPSLTHTFLVKLQKNEVEVQNDYFSLVPGGNQQEFIGFENIGDRISPEGGLHPGLLNIVFIKDSEHRSYERTVFTILDAFGSIGGLLEILTFIGSF